MFSWMISTIGFDQGGGGGSPVNNHWQAALPLVPVDNFFCFVVVAVSAKILENSDFQHAKYTSTVSSQKSSLMSKW